MKKLHLFSAEGEFKGSAVMYSPEHSTITRMRVPGDYLFALGEWHLCIETHGNGITWIKVLPDYVPAEIRALALLLT